MPLVKGGDILWRQGDTRLRDLSRFFKAQSDNMELLDACLEKNVRLVDYEVSWRNLPNLREAIQNFYHVRPFIS